MDPQNNPQQPNDNSTGGVPPTPPQPAGQFDSQQPAPSDPFQQPQVFGAQPNGQPTGVTDDGGKKKTRIVMLLIALLVILALGVVSYFVFFKKDDAKVNNNTSDSAASDAAQKSADNAQSKGTSDMALLQGVMMSLPTTPDGYEAKPDPAPGAKQYSYASEDKSESCQLFFGTTDAQSLPGKNLDEIAKPQIDQLRASGATVEGPTAGTALTLKDASSGETYTMPTIDYKIINQGSEVVVHYSAVIMKSTDRAVVNRTCGQKGGSVKMDLLTKLDAAANNIVITKK